MSPLVEYKEKKSEVHIASLNANTLIGLRETKRGVLIIQNDEIITLIDAPIMRVVRGIRSMFDNAKFERI